MRKLFFLFLLAAVSSAVATGQTPQNINANSITMKTRPSFVVNLNDSNILYWDAVSKKVVRTSVNSSTPTLQQVLIAGKNLNSDKFFVGQYAGDNATNAYSSNFLGIGAGQGATNASNSNFIGGYAGANATGSNASNFIGHMAGSGQTGASYSNLIGYQAGVYASGLLLGNHNTIIGTNITLPSGTSNGLNIGGVLFGSGLNGSYVGAPRINSPLAGKIGIKTSSPEASLHVAGNFKSLDSLGGKTGYIKVSKDSIVSTVQNEFGITNRVYVDAEYTRMNRSLVVQDEAIGYDNYGIALIDDNMATGQKGLYTTDGIQIATYVNDGIDDKFTYGNSGVVIDNVAQKVNIGYTELSVAGSNSSGVSVKERSSTDEAGLYYNGNSNAVIAAYNAGDQTYNYGYNFSSDLPAMKIRPTVYQLQLYDNANMVYNNLSFEDKQLLYSDSEGNTIFAAYEGGMQAYSSGAFVGTAVLSPTSGGHSLNFPSTAAQTSSDLTVTITGAQVGLFVLITPPPASVLANSWYTAWVSAANKVTVRFNNYSSAAQDPAAGTFAIKIIL